MIATPSDPAAARTRAHALDDRALHVVKVFNNNVVLAADGVGAESVLMGRGIGFQRRPGDELDAAAVERSFRAEATDNPERFAALIDAIPLEHVAIAEELVALASPEFGEDVARRVLVPLADHVSFALRRAASGTEIAYPLSTEVALLYPHEVAFATRALDVIRDRTGVRLSEVEAVPMALHFVNAQFGRGGDLGRVVEITEAFSEIVDLVQRRYGVELDDQSLDVARFITHLRYLFVRQQQGKRFTDGQGELLATLARARPVEYACAEEVQQLLARRFDWDAGPDELVYLTLHVARLTDAAKGSDHDA